jgi:hypothetical protein
LLAALKAAVRRGVDMTLILRRQTDSWLVFHAGSGYYDQPLRAEVKIYERVLYDESRLPGVNYRPSTCSRTFAQSSVAAQIRSNRPKNLALCGVANRRIFSAE